MVLNKESKAKIAEIAIELLKSTDVKYTCNAMFFAYVIFTDKLDLKQIHPIMVNKAGTLKIKGKTNIMFYTINKYRNINDVSEESERVNILIDSRYEILKEHFDDWLEMVDLVFDQNEFAPHNKLLSSWSDIPIFRRGEVDIKNFRIEKLTEYKQTLEIW